MSLYAVAVFPKIEPENLFQFKVVAEEMLRGIQDLESVVRYDIFFSIDNTRCVVLEEYATAAGVFEHVNKHAHFLDELIRLGGRIQGQMFPIEDESKELKTIRENWDSEMHQHFGGKKNPGSLERPG